MIKMVKHKHVKHPRITSVAAKAPDLKRKKTAKRAEETSVQPQRSVAAPPRNLTPEMKEIRARLQSMLSDTRKDIEHEVRSANERDPAHIIEVSDMATDAAEGDLALRIAESETAEAGEIERAIEKIDEGTYERCDVCDKRIADARHEFLPYVTMCINCQELEEIRRSKVGDQFEDLSEGSDGDAEADVEPVMTKTAGNWQEN